MRKMLFIVFIFTILFSGCVKKEFELNEENITHYTDTKNQAQLNKGDLLQDIDTNSQTQSKEEDVSQDAYTKNKTLTSLSPNGKYCAEAYGTITTITAGGLFPYEGIRVMDARNGDVLWKMEPGYYTVSFKWSSDSRYIGINYEARIYGKSVIFDTKDKKIILLPTLFDIVTHYGESVKPQKNRPDPYFRIIGWENPETVIVDFHWIKVDGNTFKGQYRFNIKTNTVSYE